MLTIAILAGGRSQRMGQDKAIMPFKGEMLVGRILDRLSRLDAELVIIGPKSQGYLPLRYRIASDLIPGRGPLGGLYTALHIASHPAVAVVGCDMPFINADLLAYQLNIFLAGNKDVIVPLSKGGLEPLHAIYKRDTCLLAARHAMDGGERSIVSILPLLDSYILKPDEIKAFDPLGLTFLNVNTPDEYVRAEKLASQNYGI